MSHQVHIRKFQENGKHVVTIALRPAIPDIADDRLEFDTAEEAGQSLRSAMTFAEKMQELGTVGEIEIRREAIQPHRSRAMTSDQRDAIDALIEEVAPAPYVVAETATAQFAPLLLELLQLRKALTKIRDEDEGCRCEHDTRGCCALVGHFCPRCIAARALMEEEPKP